MEEFDLSSWLCLFFGLCFCMTCTGYIRLMLWSQLLSRSIYLLNCNFLTSIWSERLILVFWGLEISSFLVFFSPFASSMTLTILSFWGKRNWVSLEWNCTIFLYSSIFWDFYWLILLFMSSSMPSQLWCSLFHAWVYLWLLINF